MALQQVHWINEPPAWSPDSGILHVSTGLNTDF